MTSVSLTSTNHAEDQPIHLQLPHTSVYEQTEDHGHEEELAAAARTQHVKTNVGEYAGLLGRACPAGVYEYVDAEKGEAGSWEGKKLVINSQASRDSTPGQFTSNVPSPCRTAFIVNSVISKCLPKISLGPFRKVEVDPSIVRLSPEESSSSTNVLLIQPSHELFASRWIYTTLLQSNTKHSNPKHTSCLLYYNTERISRIKWMYHSSFGRRDPKQSFSPRE